MSTMASQITSVLIVCSTVCTDADQRKHQSSASLAFVRGIHRWPMCSPHKGPVTRKMFPFDDTIMNASYFVTSGLFSLNAMWPRQNGRQFIKDITNAFSWIETYPFQLRFYSNLLLRFQWTICHHLFRQNLIVKAISHYLNQWLHGLLTHICVTGPHWVKQSMKVNIFASFWNLTGGSPVKTPVKMSKQLGTSQLKSPAFVIELFMLNSTLVNNAFQTWHLIGWQHNLREWHHCKAWCQDQYNYQGM